MKFAELEKRVLVVSCQNYDQLPIFNGNHVVAIINAHNPTVVIFDAEGLNDEEINDMIKMELSYITLGCNYRYEIIQRVGNCFFCN